MRPVQYWVYKVPVDFGTPATCCSQDKLEKSGDWYTGKLVPSQKRIRFKVLGPKRLEMQREEGQSFGKIVKAGREMERGSGWIRFREAAST